MDIFIIRLSHKEAHAARAFTVQFALEKVRVTTLSFDFALALDDDSSVSPSVDT